MKLFIITLVSVVHFLTSVSAIRDFTIQPGGQGCQVVSAVIQRIETSGIFSEQYFILNRIAFVFEFGKSADYSGSGIFFLTERMWARAMIAIQNLGLDLGVAEEFCVDFTSLPFQKANIPIYSGIVVMVLLMEKSLKFPWRYEYEEQAKVVCEIYGFSTENTVGTFYYNFIKYAITFDKHPIGGNCMQCKPQGTDVLFLIDASGSISDSDWQLQREFLNSFVTQTPTGAGDDEFRYGVVFFSYHTQAFEWDTFLRWKRRNGPETFADLIFDTYKKESSLTETGLGIATALDRWLDCQKYGCRLSDTAINKIMIVLTDGKSTNKSSTQYWRDQFAKIVPEVTVYAVGTKNDANMDELQYIAGSKDRARIYKSYNEFAKDFMGVLLMTCTSSASISRQSDASNQDEIARGSNSVSKRHNFGNTFTMTAKVGVAQRFSMVYRPGSIINVKLSSTKLKYKTYYSFSKIFPTAQYNDFSATIEPGRKVATLLRPPSDFLENICDKRVTPTVIPGPNSAPTTKDFGSCNSTTCNSTVIIIIVPVPVGPAKTKEYSAGKNKLDPSSGGTPGANAGEKSGGNTDGNLNGNTDANSSGNTDGNLDGTPVGGNPSDSCGNSASDSGCAVGYPDIPGLDDSGVGDIDEKGEGNESMECDAECQSENPPEEVMLETVVKDDDPNEWADYEINGVIDAKSYLSETARLAQMSFCSQPTRSFVYLLSIGVGCKVLLF